MKTNSLLFLIFFAATTNSTNFERTAFCITTVADIVRHQITDDTASYQEVKQAYESLPASWGPALKDKVTCPREHQLLLHEIVTILKETNAEAFVAVKNCMTKNEDNESVSVQGWMRKDQLEDIQYLDGYVPGLPKPINWQSGAIESEVTLISPYRDDEGIFYSAGTRFVLLEETEDSYRVAAYSKAMHRFKAIELPQTICAYKTHTLSIDERRELFCRLATMWASIPDACIPLVWGGASVGKAWEQDDYFAVNYSTSENERVTAWARPLYGSNGPYMGLDASGGILRALQSIGIAYFCRNSLTAYAELEQYALHETFKKGDLIWLPGALLIITSLEDNLVVTAMSYTSGYGAWTTLQLHAVFKGIYSYQDLRNAYQHNKELTLLNKDGSIARTAPFAILKLPLR